MDDDAAAIDYFDREARIMRAALHSVQKLERYHDTPQQDGGVTRLGWLWDVLRKPIHREQAEVRLRADLFGELRALRGRVWTLPALDDVRAAVLVHAALALGQQRLLDNRPLWEALRVQDYDAAEHVLLSSHWPALAGDDAHARARLLALTRALRTGVPP